MSITYQIEHFRCVPHMDGILVLGSGVCKELVEQTCRSWPRFFKRGVWLYSYCLQLRVLRFKEAIPFCPLNIVRYGSFLQFQLLMSVSIFMVFGFKLCSKSCLLSVHVQSESFKQLNFCECSLYSIALMV